MKQSEREKIMRHLGAELLHIRQTGAVEAYGKMPNTNRYGWYFAGWLEDIRKEMEQ